MNTKKTLLTAVIASTLVVSAVAIASPHGRGCDRDGLPPVFKSLELSATQEAQVEAILKEQRGKMRDLDRQQRQAMKEETKAELAKVLNSDQLAKLESLRDRRSEYREERRELREEYGYRHGRGHDHDDD